MPKGRDRGVLATAIVATAILARSSWLAMPAEAAAELVDDPVIVTVGEAKGPVGQPTRLLASLKLKDGYQFYEPLPRGNRVIELSSADEGVKFSRRVFRGQLDDNSITFNLEVTPTKPGTHAINGLFRVGYVVHTNTEHKIMQVSLPLITTVVGVE